MKCRLLFLIFFRIPTGGSGGPGDTPVRVRVSRLLARCTHPAHAGEVGRGLMWFVALDRSQHSLHLCRRGPRVLVTARQTGRLELPCNTKICKRCAAVSRRRQAQLGSTYRPKKKGVCSITGLPHRASCTAKPVMPIMAARPFLISASCMSLVGKYSVYLLSGSKP